MVSCVVKSPARDVAHRQWWLLRTSAALLRFSRWSVKVVWDGIVSLFTRGYLGTKVIWIAASSGSVSMMDPWVQVSTEWSNLSLLIHMEGNNQNPRGSPHVLPLTAMDS